MSLKQELKDLQKQKQTELRNLHDTYLATKRDVKRQMAPDRIVRRHAGVSMAVAAVMGMLLAPRPSGRITADGKKEKKGGFFGGGILMGLLGGLFRLVLQLVGHFTGSTKQFQAPAPGEAPAPRKATGWVQSLVEGLLRQVDFNKMITDVVHSFGGGTRKDTPAAAGNGHLAEASARHEATLPPDKSEEQ